MKALSKKNNLKDVKTKAKEFKAKFSKKKITTAGGQSLLDTELDEFMLRDNGGPIIKTKP